MLGAFADDEGFDRPDLNQCPDCKCFFEGDNCPLCGKECPENMRAGKRPAAKVHFCALALKCRLASFYLRENSNFKKREKTA